MSQAAAEEDFRELELYLQQAQEEIGQVLSTTQASDIAEDGVAMETSVITKDNQDDIAQQLDAEATLDNILLLYDNMEFYASKNRSDKFSGCKLNDGVKGQGHFNNNFEGYQNELKRDIKSDYQYDVFLNSTVAVDSSLPDESDNVNICQSSVVNTPSATNHLKDVRMLSDAFTSEQHQSVCTNDKSSSYKPGTKTSRSLDENCIKNVSQGSLHDGQNHMDDLMNCNSHIATCCRLKKQTTEKIQEVSHHLKHDENQVAYRSANEEKSLHISKTENLSIKSPVTQIERKLSWDWKCDKEDNSKLDNVVIDRDTRKVDVSKCDNRLNRSTCDSDLSGFIEEINESLDELISEGESGISDDSVSVKFSDLSSSESNSFNSSSDGSSSVNSRNTSMENVKIGYKTNDGGSIKSVDSVNVQGDDVVETDSGYYWLTCNIDEVDKTRDGTIDCDIEISKSSYANEKKHEVGNMMRNSKAQEGDKVAVLEKPHFVEEFENLLQNMQSSGRKIAKRNSDKSNSSNSDETVEFSSGKYETIVDDILETCSGDSIDTSSSESSGINEGIPAIMTMSAPNFLSLDRSSLNRNRISRDDSHIQTVSIDNLQHQSLKRKHSAPPSLGKVYKVVSVDIPKLNLSKMADKSGRYGDASKACVNRESTFNALKKFGADEDHRLSKSGRIDCNLSVKGGTKPKQYLHKDNREMECKGSIWDHAYSSTDNVSVMDTSFEPPAMFQDDPSEDDLGNHGNNVEVSRVVHTGPILKPPPAFATDSNGPSIMDSYNSASAISMVWDPGVNLPAPSGGEHINTLRENTLDRKFKHPSTPPPPSVDRTERLISSTLNQHKHRKYSADANSGLLFLVPPEIVRRKSADSGIRSKAKSDADVDLNGNNSENSFDLNTFRKSCPDKMDFERRTVMIDSHKVMNDKMSKSVNLDMNGVLVSKNSISSVRNSQQSNTINQKLERNMLDLLDTYHTSDGNLVNNNNINSDNQSDVTVVKSESDINENCIYAQVNKKSANKRMVNGKDTSKCLKPVKSPVPPPIPQRISSLPDVLQNCHTAERKSKPKESKHSRHEPSPELEVMFNSLSPVLLRRKLSANKKLRKNGGSVETSPERTPNVSPRAEKVIDKMTRPDKVKSSSEWKPVPTPVEPLFMDPEMARTWHGATSSNWSQFYGSELKEMMKELKILTNGSYDTSQDSLSTSEDDYERGCQTMPTKSSLLDEMHKKFCADQYRNSKETEVSKALVLLRLKSAPAVKPKRSQSFNIRMGTGTSSSSASSESSPLLPRVSERIRIKTRPDCQYSPKPTRIRAVTPDGRSTNPEIQAQSSKKEDAEIEAIEACRWLRETGFPQYAQLYEDGEFPIEIDSVEKDHEFLDKDDIQSLFRRLNTLNKCAIMKIGTPTKKESEESDEEDQCALSDKWKYQRSSRRWSRKDLDSPMIENKNGQAVLKSSSSHDSLLTDHNSSSEPGDSPVLDCKMHYLNDDKMSPLDANGNTTIGVSPNVIRRAATERIKGAKSFLKRMESLKGKRSRKHRTITEISGPVITDNEDMQARIKHLNCKDIASPTDETKTLLSHDSNRETDLNGSNISADNSLITSPRTDALTVTSPGAEAADVNSLSSSEASPLSSPDKNENLNILNNTSSGNSIGVSDNGEDMSMICESGAISLDLSSLSQQSESSENTNSSEDNLFSQVKYRPGRFPSQLDDSLFRSDRELRTRSFSCADENSPEDNSPQGSKNSRRGSHDPRNKMHRVSIYDNVPIEEDLTVAQQELDIILSELFQNINGLNKAINGDDAEILEPPITGVLDTSRLSFIDDDDDDNTPENEPNFDTNSNTTHDHDETEVISGTLSSPDISDHELHTEDMSHDDSSEHLVYREWRDSGVGSSLTRTNSDRRKYRIRWHSFQKSHRPTSESRNLQLCNLSAGQILVLKKLSLLKLTALVEKYSPNRSGWSLTVPRFMKRNKVPDYKDKNVFGVPFSVVIQRTGQALPQCILHAMRFLRRTADEALGIFRKSGVRTRIQKLRNEIEANPEIIDFEELQAYDVADLVKQYFRELPECLLTNKLSDIFISIFIYVPTELRLEALQAAVVLMADENRDVLQSLLLFLSDIAKHHSKHQMTASNLAVCFAPSLFNLSGVRCPSMTPSPRRNRKNIGVPDARELMEQKAAHECLTEMIKECKKMFTIPSGTLSKCRTWHGDPVSINDLNSGASEGNQGYMSYIDSCIQGLLKESREKFRGWMSVTTSGDVDVSYKKVGDGHPLRLWKCTVDIEAPPNEVLNRVINDRQMWDEDLLQWNTVEKLDKQTEVFQYVRNSMAPHPTRNYCVLRSWRTDLPKGACVLISTSIDHPEAEVLGGIQGVELASRYLIEPCGTGKSRLTHISRVDTRGHSPDWYKKVYGHICANFMKKIRSSFHTSTDGPETKV